MASQIFPCYFGRINYACGTCALHAFLKSVNCAACHIESFGDGHDQTSLETVFHFHCHQHGDHLQPCISCEFSLFGVIRGCLLIGGIPRFHHSLKLACQTMTLFSLLLTTITFEQMTIKHSLYMHKIH